MQHVPLAHNLIGKGTCLFKKNILDIKDSVLGNLRSKRLEFIEYQFQKFDIFSKEYFNYSDP